MNTQHLVVVCNSRVNTVHKWNSPLKKPSQTVFSCVCTCMRSGAGLTDTDLWNRLRNLNRFQWGCCTVWLSNRLLFEVFSLRTLAKTSSSWQGFFGFAKSPVKHQDSTSVMSQPVPFRSCPVQPVVILPLTLSSTCGQTVLRAACTSFKLYLSHRKKKQRSFPLPQMNWIWKCVVWGNV